MKRLLRRMTSVFGVVGVLLSSTAWAQSTGTISGTVLDGSAASLPGATVTARNEGTGAVREVVTDESGRFTLPLLPIGRYAVTATMSGFQSQERSGVMLEVQASLTLEFTLGLAGLTDSVTVTGGATVVQLQRNDANLGQLINAAQVAELPLNGRNFVQLALLGPGVVTGRAGSFLAQGPTSEVSYRGSMSVSAQGMRENANDWLYDGIDDNELTAGGVGILPNVDSIREFKVLTHNYQAQYGSRGGTTVLVSSKAGENAFRGSAFEFFRNDALDARNPFDGATKRPWNQNTYGGSLGGPVRRNRTFFFAGFQGNNIDEGLTTVLTVPTALMRQGIFTESFPGAPATTIFDPATTRVDPTTGQLIRDPFPGNQIPADRISPIGRALVELLPLPTRMDRLGGNFLANPVKTLNDYQGDLRIDHNFSNSDRIFARYSAELADQYLPTGLPDFGAPAAFQSNQTFDTSATNVALSHTHVFKGGAVNQFTAGYNRVYNTITSFGYGSNKSQALGIPGANLGTAETSSLTRMTFQNFAGVGDRGFSPFIGGTNVYHYTNAFTVVKGNHTLNTGGTFRAMQLNLLGDTALAGQFAFTPFFTSGFNAAGSLNGATGNSIASLLLGLPASGGRNDQLNGSVKGRRWKEYRIFFDDTWRVSQSLTLTLGMAYMVTTPQSEAKDRFANFDFYTGKIFVGGTVGVKTDWSNVQPRIGFAWSPGSAKTVVRGGYGIYHDVSAIGGSTGPYQNPPFANAYSFVSDNITPVRTLATGFPPNNQPIDPATHRGDWTTIDPNIKQGRIQQWSLNVERQLPFNSVFGVAYAGTYADRLFDKSRNLNTATPGTGFNPAARRPYPNLVNVTTALSRGWLKYNSLQLRLERRATGGNYILAAYTYARALTNGVSGFGGDPGIVYFPVVTDDKADIGSANTDLRHNLSVSTLVQIPFGKGRRFMSNAGMLPQALFGDWSINTIFIAHSGYPLGMSMANNQSGTAFGNRPNRICDGRNDNPTPQRWFDTSCFAAPAVGVLGNAARTTLFGPGRYNIDMAVVKRMARFQFRAEAFNLLNNPQYAVPNTVVGSPLFGQITSTVKGSRQIQLALKYVF
ncbi:MAG: carboxypeptidase regulatory-like domain-containing protein [Acidobacteria bacterium]|nr:carboxypeptidase regulatory-like domain-containing protein [Acidobacteriota bacterium]